MNNWNTTLNSFILQAKEGDLKTSSYPKEYSDLKMKVSFGMGVSARIPWIAFTAPEMQVSKGFYPVYLYYKEQDPFSFYEGNEYNTYKLLERAKSMLKRHEPIQPAWVVASGGRTVGELPEMIERLENQWNSERTEVEGLKFQNIRNAINSEYLKRGSEDFSTALKEWKDYLANPKVVGRDKKKAELEVEKVNRQANGAWRSLRNQAERKSSEDAIRLLKKELPRFQGVTFKGVDLGKEIEKKIKSLGG